MISPRPTCCKQRPLHMSTAWDESPKYDMTQHRLNHRSSNMLGMDCFKISSQKGRPQEKQVSALRLPQHGQ